MNVVESNSGRALMVVLGGINVKFGTELEIFFQQLVWREYFYRFTWIINQGLGVWNKTKVTSNFEIEKKQINKKTEGWGCKINFSRQCFFLSNTLKFAD